MVQEGPRDVSWGKVMQQARDRDRRRRHGHGRMLPGGEVMMADGGRRRIARGERKEGKKKKAQKASLDLQHKKNRERKKENKDVPYTPIQRAHKTCERSGVCECEFARMCELVCYCLLCAATTAAKAEAAAANTYYTTKTESNEKTRTPTARLTYLRINAKKKLSFSI